ncbi:MAG: cytochrome-c peroxidase [Flavobacteriia bacterium]|nr:cytochrome-c peroxidase [Flavobacteriia bacterium]
MKVQFLYLFVVISITLILFSFDQKEDFFEITKKDVKFIVPKGFPEPNYKFKNNKLTPEIFLIGRKLFYDEILSKDNTVSCASCHERIAAFAHVDHKLSHGIYGKIGTRNVPPIQNMVWKTSFMWDGGINHIEVQPIGPITNKIEMDETIENVIFKIKKDPIYVQMFQKAYKDDIISSERIMKSLTQFIGMMVSSNSRYDRFIQQKDTLSKLEKNGLTLFRQKCASCHTEPLFSNNQFLSNGLKMDSTLKDYGRYSITKKEEDKLKFSVPSLRNIEMTYPYMHDGRFKKLSDVLNFYSNSSLHSENVDARVKNIGVLSADDKKSIIAFLLTLTDKSFLYDRRFVDPEYVFRKE